MKETGGRGNLENENENETHDLDFTQAIFQREEEGYPLDCSDLEVSPSVL